jgi:hypothetical protein
MTRKNRSDAVANRLTQYDRAPGEWKRLPPVRRRQLLRACIWKRPLEASDHEYRALQEWSGWQRPRAVRQCALGIGLVLVAMILLAVEGSPFWYIFFLLVPAAVTPIGQVRAVQRALAQPR